MAKGSKKFTVIGMKSKKDGIYPVGDRLYYQVRNEGKNTSWTFRFSMDKKSYTMGLGSVESKTLAEAKLEALQLGQEIKKGNNPLLDKRRQQENLKAKTKNLTTFKECAELFLIDQKDRWKNPKTQWQWPKSLSKYAYPVVGDIPIADIKIEHILKILKPIWSEVPVSASKARIRIAKVLDWAKAKEYRTGDNPAAWKGALEFHLPTISSVHEVNHQKSLPYKKIKKFIKDLREQDCITARAVEFMILTATRPSETRKLLWADLNIKAKLWTIPKGRTKTKLYELRIPLSDRAIEILKEQQKIRVSDYVFCNAKGKAYSDMAMLMLVKKRMNYPITNHGFRTTFRMWSGELRRGAQHVYSKELLESALGHVEGTEVERAYWRGDYLDMRRPLMKAWAKYCEPVKPKNRLHYELGKPSRLSISKPSIRRLGMAIYQA